MNPSAPGPFLVCSGGCGRGEHLNRAGERGWQVTGVRIKCPECQQRTKLAETETK